jgi:hypothetical protein
MLEADQPPARHHYPGRADNLKGTAMMSPSPAAAEKQFQNSGNPTNLDSCTRCGAPRSAHGPDWNCPARAPHSASTVPLVLGSLLTLIGLIVLVAVGANLWNALGTLGVIAILSGLTLLVAGVTLRRRLR